MSCGRVSLLTNVTREPGATVTFFGDTPARRDRDRRCHGAAGATATAAAT